MKRSIFLLLIAVVLGGFAFAQAPADAFEVYNLEVAMSENSADTCTVNSDSVLTYVSRYQDIAEAVIDFYKSDGYEKHVRLWERQYQARQILMRGCCCLMKTDTGQLRIAV